MTSCPAKRSPLHLPAILLALLFTLSACATAVPLTTPSPSPESTATPIPAATPSPQAFRLTILHNNDGESQLIHAGRDREDFGGVARFAALVAKLRQEAHASGSSVLVVSAGDNFRAGPEFSASLERESAPFYDIIALDHIGYDAMVLGNHEFDFGPDVLADAISGSTSTVPFISANLDFSGEPRLAVLAAAGRLARSAVLEFDGERVGIIGATTPGLRYLSSPRNVQIAKDVAAVVQQEIDAMEAAGINKIIVVSHLQGIAGDVALGAALRGVDILIAGGGDELLANESDLLLPGDEEKVFGTYPLLASDADGNDVPVVGAPGRYTYVGRLIVEFDVNGTITAIDASSGPVRVAGGDHPDAVEPHPPLQELVVNPVADFISGLAATTVGTTEVSLDGQRHAIRTRETNQGNLIADALLWQANELADRYRVQGADVALQNGGGIRNDNVLPAGTLYELDIYNMAPFPNFLAIVPNVSVEQFKEILENAVSRVEHIDGRFPQIAGFTMTWDPNGTSQVLDDDGRVVTPGTRIRSVQLGDGTWLVRDGDVVADAGPVHVATLNFLARGGDEYPFRDAPFVSLGVTYQQAIANYIAQGLGGVVTAERYPEGGEGRNVATDPPARQ
ncbi:MAG: bifunctional UDP-sugar hydrolase/5'-nucleotidase [Chloroflexi bacterium]|nr:bifunctional UDP-sugar hydrolase/5'-nucleotidase [Chloroflexota bacterium]